MRDLAISYVCEAYLLRSQQRNELSICGITCERYHWFNASTLVRRDSPTLKRECGMQDTAKSTRVYDGNMKLRINDWKALGELTPQEAGYPLLLQGGSSLICKATG